MAVAAHVAAVSVRGLRHHYAVEGMAGPLLAVAGVDLAVRPGEFVSLVGPSGCGKTTLLRAVAGLLRASEGSVEVLGGAPEQASAAHAVGLVAQEPGLLPWRTVEANVALSLQLAGAESSVAASERVVEALRRVGIDRFARYHPRELSGGMRQRVAVARALVHRPRLLLMDEPFGALDELSREELCVELLRLWEAERVSVLFVTHSVREAVLLSDRVVVMSRAPGRIVADVRIELPRPRDPRVLDTPEAAQHVAEVRAALGAGVA